MLREFFLLSRWEQRGLLMVSALLILSLAGRIIVRAFPEREPEGMEDFTRELAIKRAPEARSLSQDTVMAPLKNKGQKRKRTFPNKAGNKKVPAPKIQLNSIDSAGLLPLPGIGPVYAGRIIKYRSLLGGFVNKGQLLEVYGMDSARLEPLMDMIRTDTSAIIKLNPSTAKFRELLRHPYLEYEDVLALVKYRDMEGPIDSSGEIRQNMLLTDSTLQKIHPYFKWQ